MPLPSVKQFYIDLGKKIYQHRANQGITQEQLGDQLKLTRLSIINLEKGRHRPSIYQLLQIAEYLGLSISDLLPRIAPTTRIKKTFKEKLRMVSDQDQKLDKTTQAFVNKILKDLNS